MSFRTPQLAVLLALLLGPATAVAQQAAVLSGIVRSDAQLPIGGAIVRIVELNLLSVSRDDGQYRITVPAPRVTGQAVTIEVSSIGYRSTQQTLTLRAGGTVQNFVLVSQAVQLDEVVVTGTVGRLERRAQGATVAQINATQVQQVAPVQSVSNLLQARTPGVSIRNTGGTSGVGSAIVIRGMTSLDDTNGTPPLVFIDGVSMSGQLSQIFGVGDRQGSRLNDIKIEDIESIEVVKGPAASALYGSDASAGVINIITKRGRAQSGFQQSFTIEYGEADPNFEPPDNYARCRAQDLTNANLPRCAGQTAGTIFVDNPLKRTQPFINGRYRNFNYSLRGGTDRYTAALSLGADDENGTLPLNEYGHLNARSNFEFFPTEKIRVGAGFAVMQTVTQLPQNDNNIYGYLGGALLGDPRTLGGAKDGWYGNNRQVSAIKSIENRDKSVRFQPRLEATYTPFPWFTNRLMVGGDMLRTRAYSLFAKNDSSWFDNPLLNTGQISEARRMQDRFTFDYLGNITRSLLAPVRLDLSFGAQAITNRTDLTDVQGRGLINNTVRSVDAASVLSNGGQTTTESRRIGVFGQTMFSVLERLYVKAALRADQSSVFGADSDPYYSPSTSVSYVLSDEPLFQRNVTDRLPEGMITTLRLKAAYGITGRQPTSGIRSTFDPSANQISATQVVVGVRPGDTGNRNLRNEKGEEWEFGFELGMLRDRLGIQMDYYNKKSLDQILELPVANSQGSSEPDVNIGSVLNQGFEFAVNARPITHRNVALDLRLAGHTLRNRVLSLGDSAQRAALESTTIKLGLPAIGTWQYPIREVDLANNRVIVSDTLEYVGNRAAFPAFEGTLSATLTLFGNLSLYAQMDTRQDYVLNDATGQFRDRQNGFTAPAVLGPAAYGTNADGTPTDEAKVKWMRRFGCIPPNFGLPNQGSCNAWTTETWVDEDGNQRGGRTLSRTTVLGDYLQDASFTRLREVSVSYRVPTQMVQRYMRAQSATVSLAMRNLNMWTDFLALDPETDQFLTVPQDRRWTLRFFFTF
jgi:TonB-linked SusC/RagA family outer membrane protein